MLRTCYACLYVYSTTGIYYIRTYMELYTGFYKSNAFDSCNTERFTVTPHSCLLFSIVGITPATVASRGTPTTPTTAVNIATPTGPHPSITGNIIVQFDDLYA